MDIRAAFAKSQTSTVGSIEHALALLDQALSILDSERQLVAAAKVDDVRHQLREVMNKAGCLLPS